MQQEQKAQVHLAAPQAGRTSGDALANAPWDEKSGHTPGPWKVRAGFMGAAEVYPHRRKKRGEVGVPTEVATVDGCYDEWRANARLIAAAPELLEALIELHEAETAPYPSFEAATSEAQNAWAERRGSARERALAAIAKATGGSQ